MNDDIKRDAAVGLLLLSTALTGGAQGQGTATTPLPEIAALMPSGHYTGIAHRGARAFDVALVIEETKPGGRFTGTVLIQEATESPCASTPVSGVLRPNGAVLIESGEGVVRGCERRLDLRLEGKQLSGTLTAPAGTAQISLKRHTP